MCYLHRHDEPEGYLGPGENHSLLMLALNVKPGSPIVFPFRPQSCFSATQLLRIHQLSATNTTSLGRNGLTQLSPALLQQVLSGACVHTEEPSTPSGQLSQTESKRQKPLKSRRLASCSGPPKSPPPLCFCRIPVCDPRQRGDHAHGHVWHCDSAVHRLHKCLPDVHPVLRQPGRGLTDRRRPAAPATNGSDMKN